MSTAQFSYKTTGKLTSHISKIVKFSFKGSCEHFLLDVRCSTNHTRYCVFASQNHSCLRIIFLKRTFIAGLRWSVLRTRRSFLPFFPPFCFPFLPSFLQYLFGSHFVISIVILANDIKQRWISDSLGLSWPAVYLKLWTSGNCIWYGRCIHHGAMWGQTRVNLNV